MGDLVKRNIGYHRAALILCTVLVFMLYPSEIPKFEKDDLSWVHLKVFAPYLYLFLWWITLSDTLANIWRLADFIRKKTKSLNWINLICDLFLIALLALCYHFRVAPQEEGSEQLQSMAFALVP